MVFAQLRCHSRPAGELRSLSITNKNFHAMQDQRLGTDCAAAARKEDPGALIGEQVRVYDERGERTGTVTGIVTKFGRSTKHVIMFDGEPEEVLLQKARLPGKGVRFHVLVPAPVVQEAAPALMEGVASCVSAKMQETLPAAQGPAAVAAGGEAGTAAVAQTVGTDAAEAAIAAETAAVRLTPDASSGAKIGKEPPRDFAPCAFLIAANSIAATTLFSPAIMGTNNGAGVICLLGSPIYAVLVAFALADRDRWRCARPATAAAAAGTAPLLSTIAAELPHGLNIQGGQSSVVNPVADCSGVNPGVGHAGAGTGAVATVAGVHGPMPRPEIFAAGAPTPAYLELCAAAAEDLEEALLDMPLEERTQAERHLVKKHGLCYAHAAAEHAGERQLARSLLDNSLAAGGAGGKAMEGSTAIGSTIDARAKVLRSMVMRYPAPVEPLQQGNFDWAPNCMPLRAGGDVALDTALVTWVDQTTSAADSALFSSLGVWISPYAVALLALNGFGFAGIVLTEETNIMRWTPLAVAANVFSCLACLVAAAVLRAGKRRLATSCFALGVSICAVCYLANGASAACKCWGPYASTHLDTGNAKDNIVGDYPWQYAAYSIMQGIASLPVVALATHPHRTFELFFILMPTCFMLACIPYVTDFARFGVLANNPIPPFVFGLGIFIWHRRCRALALGGALGEADAARYAALWEGELLLQPGFRNALVELQEAWHEVQAGAAQDVPRFQRAHGLGALFREADALNDVLHAKLFDLCTEHGGKFYRSDVKAEARAMQKAFRTYGGNWRRLNDLCRSSLVFDSVPQMAACLRAISNDAELCVVPSGDGKMRLREKFDAVALSGGYRDVQLTVLLDTAETRARGVHGHLAEVQLHLTPILALKSEGGHKNYVLRRNLKGQ
jgi:hypothetical protein